MNDTQYLSAILNHINNIIIFLSSDLKITKLNQPAQRLFSEPEKQIVGSDFTQLCQQHHIPCPLSNNKDLKDIETTINETILHWTISPTPNGLLLIAYDLTLLRQEQDKNFQLDSIIAQMPNNVYWCDKNFKYLGMNYNTAKTVGMSRKQAIGKNIYDFAKNLNLIDGTISLWDRTFNEVILKGLPASLDREIPPFKNAENKIVYQLTNIVPLFDKKGKITAALAISVDITDRKMAEKALREAKEINKTKTHFMTTMAQALKTPIINALATFKLLAISPLNRKQKKYLKQADQHLSEAQKLLQDILDYANTDAEEQNTNIDKFDLSKLINEIEQKHNKQFKKNKITSAIDCAPEIPKQVIGDYECMRMLLDSLYTNAPNFLDNGQLNLQLYTQKCQEIWETEVILKITMDSIKNDLPANQQLYVSELNGAEFLFQTGIII